MAAIAALRSAALRAPAAPAMRRLASTEAAAAAPAAAGGTGFFGRLGAFATGAGLGAGATFLTIYQEMRSTNDKLEAMMERQRLVIEGLAAGR